MIASRHQVGWLPAVESAPSDDVPPSPAPRSFRLKAREFTVDNVPISTPTSFEPTDVREHFQAAAGALLTPIPPTAKNDVHDLLAANLAAAQAAGLNDVKPVGRRPSRRLRDYLLVAVPVNLTIAGVALFFHSSPVVLVFALAGFVMFNLRLAWSMWVVMDDY